MVNLPRWKGYGALVATFILGIATGGAASHAYAQHQYAKLVGDRTGMMDGRRLIALSRRLGLDDTQRERIRAIMEEHAGERRDLTRDMYERCGQPLRAKEDQVDAEVRAVLNPNQQTRYEEMSHSGRERGLGGRRDR